MFCALVFVVPQTALRLVVTYVVGRVLFGVGYKFSANARMVGGLISGVFAINAMTGLVVIFALRAAGPLSPLIPSCFVPLALQK